MSRLAFTVAHAVAESQHVIKSRLFYTNRPLDWEAFMRRFGFLIVLLSLVPTLRAQQLSDMLSDLTRPHDYVLTRASSWDRTGGNADSRPIEPGQTLTVLDAAGPGTITHVWLTIASGEKYHLKKLVLRMYWDNEATPSVEAPIGDFFGLGLGEYFTYQSLPLSVGSVKALNSFFPMPFRKSARVTVTNEGMQRV